MTQNVRSRGRVNRIADAKKNASERRKGGAVMTIEVRGKAEWRRGGAQLSHMKCTENATVIHASRMNGGRCKNQGVLREKV